MWVKAEREEGELCKYVELKWQGLLWVRRHLGLFDGGTSVAALNIGEFWVDWWLH